jgi:hypothetical protein
MLLWLLPDASGIEESGSRFWGRKEIGLTPTLLGTTSACPATDARTDPGS